MKKVNYYRELANILKIELYTPFKVGNYYSKVPDDDIYRFTKDGFEQYDDYDNSWDDTTDYLEDLISGEYIIFDAVWLDNDEKIILSNLDKTYTTICRTKDGVLKVYAESGNNFISLPFSHKFKSIKNGEEKLISKLIC